MKIKGQGDYCTRKWIVYCFKLNNVKKSVYLLNWQVKFQFLKTFNKHSKAVLGIFRKNLFYQKVSTYS